jgi:hypothetical protein
MADLGEYDIEKLKELISQLDSESGPLTKTKAKKVSKPEPVEQQIETIPEKPKKGWTPAKQEAFKKVQEARAKQVAEIKKQKTLESAKVLFSELEIKNKKTEPGPPARGADPELDYEPYDSSSSSSEEEIVIKTKKSSAKKAKPSVDKKKKTKTIIIQSDSDNDDDDNNDGGASAPPKKQRDFKSARNKKSVVKIHGEKTFNPDNFFV